MAAIRGALSVTIPAGSALDLSKASYNVGSFANFVFTPSAYGAAQPSGFGLPSYAHRAVGRVQVGTAAWSADISDASAPGISGYPNASLGIITSAGDPKPVSFPCNAAALKLAALGGTAIVNLLFYEGQDVDI